MEATVKFSLYRGYLIVAAGSASPLTDLNFVLDTGASSTILDKRLALKLHLDELPTSVAVLDGRVQAGKAIVRSLEFGPLHRDNFPVLIQDLSFLEKALSVRVDAVIGLDALGQSTFVVDYTSREIRFGPPVLQLFTILCDGLTHLALRGFTVSVGYEVSDPVGEASYRD